jgi:hypothetical protein
VPAGVPATPEAAEPPAGVAAAGTVADSGADLALEQRAIARLRSRGGWTTVDVRFHEPPALLNHMRIAVVRPALSAVGQDVVDFVASHLFLG